MFFYIVFDSVGRAVGPTAVGGQLIVACLAYNLFFGECMDMSVKLHVFDTPGMLVH